MSANLRRLLLIIVSTSLIPVIWGAGWYLYGELKIYETMANLQYQNILLIFMGLQACVFCGWAFSVRQPLSNFDKKLLKKMVKQSFSKAEKLLVKHDTKIEQLYQDVADLKIAFTLKPIDKTNTAVEVYDKSRESLVKEAKQLMEKKPKRKTQQKEQTQEAIKQ